MGSLTEGMSQRFELSWVTYPTQRPEYTNQSNYLYLEKYSSVPNWHQTINGATLARNIVVASAEPDTFFLAGNATTTMNSNGMTLLSAVTGQDDTFGYVPLPFEFRFFGTNYSNAGAAPALYWNTNNVVGFGTGRGDITWSAANPGILIGNTDRRTNTFYYSGLQTSGTTNYITMLLWAQNIYNDGVSNVIRYQLRLFRSPNYQYVELRINNFGATQGTWNIANGTAFQNTFGAYSATAGTSWVLRSDLNGSNWTFSNNYYINLP